ncbi:SMI1/KNR4 family protein [Massilia sp. DJPM01]|uniref:SMI1/KNR4 family protein n=1 Tax=Massilia sp. DJPM01 TaxID=3024404 RepID=UPI00259E3F1C|nr:SMI1/KNR4 family protein [Massilia sp. DJPM01]MDM5178022.1 SMI1/KNR4 family protein [Massilia sp. DJPM01]
MTNMTALLRKAGVQLRKKEYAACLAFADAALPILEELSDDDALDDEDATWSAYFQLRLASLDKLDLPGDMTATCEAVLERFPVDQDDLDDEERITLANVRTALTSLAVLAARRGDVDAAVESIERCFRLVASDAEHDDPFVDRYQQRASIYLRAYQSAPQRYREGFFASVYQLEYKAGKVHDVRIDDAALVAYLADPAYLAFKASHPVERLRIGAAGETWQAALERFRALAHQLRVAQDSPLCDAHFTLECKPVTPADLDAREQKWACKLPAALRALYLEQGSVEVQDPEQSGSLRLYPAHHWSMILFGGLVDMIIRLWGDRWEFGAYFTDAELAFLDANFFIFGHVKNSENRYTHLFFDREGRFGSVTYDQDDWNKMAPQVKAMLKGKLTGTMSLDALMSDQIDGVIDCLIERDDEARLNID